MNKQEAIENINDLRSFVLEDGPFEVDLIIKNQVLEIISKIDEPHEPVVPKFVAEWLKKYRYAHTLLEVLNAAEKEQIVPSAVNDWILDNQYDFIKALFDGYEEEEDETE